MEKLDKDAALDEEKTEGVVEEDEVSDDVEDAGSEAEAGGADDPVSQELARLKEVNLRLQADFDNFRRRTRADMESIGLYANESLIKSLLPVLDNLDRALSQAGEAEDPFVSGIILVRKQFMGALEKAGLTEIESVGKPFDPNFHEAVGQVPVEGMEDDHVADELQKGYILGSRVIRASVVRVVKN